MKALINGIGWATAAGLGSGRIERRQPLIDGDLEIPTRKQLFDGVDRRFGRLDDFSRIGLAAATFCLRDAQAELWQEKRSLGIIAASRYGCLNTDLDYLETMLPDQGKLASPNLFAYTLPNCFLGEVTLRFGLTGNSVIINQDDPGKMTAVRFALQELCWSDQEGMLAGIVDLAPPPDLAKVDDIPGSLFLLLEKRARPGLVPYGKLEMHDGGLTFNDSAVLNLKSLVSDCLAIDH
ncbi:MAG: beta-ketoacyl synthase [Desulfuromonas sp.]|nr:MAG: beta-ketoacyl synthase [Desulfuromonas sp.]